MMGEIKKFDIKGLFAQSRQTIEEAEEKLKSEAYIQRADRFRMNKDGEYNIRILPLAPIVNEDGTIQEMDRKGYEYPVRQLFMKIEIPGKKNKNGEIQSVTVPTINVTDKGVGFSVDLIDEYVKIAKRVADDDVVKKITSNSFEGGLKWQYSHCMYVLDLEQRNEGIKLCQISHSQYRDLEDAKMSVWRDLKEDSDEEIGCPISSFDSAYPVRVKRTTEKRKTTYTVTVNTVKRPSALTEDELNKLLDMPRIPEEIYRYSRYLMEATVEFLKQNDEKYQIDVVGTEEFQAAVEKLKGELSADDTSHFDIMNSGKGEEASLKDGVITLDLLWAENDALAESGSDERSDEYQELREKIRQFIEDNNYDVRISHSKTNEQLLEEIDEFVKGDARKEEPGDDAEAKPLRAGRRRPAVDDQDDESESEPEPVSEPEPEPEPEPAPEPVKRRRRR